MGLNWLDIAVIGILLLGALNGMAKGFILSIFNIVGMIASLLGARYITPFAVGFLVNNTGIYLSLKELFTSRMSSINPSTIHFIRLFSEGKGAIEEILTMIFINVAAFICLFMIFTLLLNVIRDSIRLTVKKTPLKYVDTVGGIVIGLLKSAIIIYMVFAVAVPTLGFFPQKNEIMKIIDSSSFAKNFYYYNIILSWFKNLYSM